MTIYENEATQAIVSIFKNDALWKKEILFNFLLKPFGVSYEYIVDVTCQDYLKETIPDFTVRTKDKDYRYEVKINDAPLTESEGDSDNRNAFLVPKKYYHMNDIPLDKNYILFWEVLFEEIDKKGATNDFGKLELTREYLTNNSEDAYFKNNIKFLFEKIINHESLRAFYRETFNKFFEYARKNNKIELDDDTFYLESDAIFSRLENKETERYITIEYSYNDGRDFCCHPYGKAGSNDFKDLDVDFSECENLFARVEYLIDKVLPQYKSILGKDYDNFFKSEDLAQKDLYLNIEEVFESEHMSPKLGDRLIKERLKSIVEEIAAENKLELYDFYLSSEKWSGFYFKKERWDIYQIGFEFENRAYRDFGFGIKIPDGGNCKTKNLPRTQQLKKLIIPGTRDRDDDWWPKSEYAPKEIRNWDIETFKLLLTERKEFKKYIEDGLKKYLNALKSANLF
ncbi:MAG: hypothetical protein IKQ13_00670 [Treponema sp.]|nr:hypothetical protein [Treponema sp.]